MYEPLIADLLDRCIDLDEDAIQMIEGELKCLTGLPADDPLDLSA